MRIQNTQTGKEGYIRVYTWWQGYEFPVFVNGELEFWKQEHIKILHDRPIIRTVRKIHKEYYDPFEGYTENELDALLESMTGYQMFKDFLQIDRIKRILDSFIEKIRRNAQHC